MASPVRVLQILCVCAAIAAARPASAGIEPHPFLDFNYVSNNATAAHFEVVLPAVPPDPIIPVEILSLSLTATDPVTGVLLMGRDTAPVGAVSGPSGIVDFSLINGSRPADGTSVMFDLMVDVARFMDSNPVSVNPPDDGIPGPVDAFEVMFDVLFDNSVAHHLLSFAAADGLMFSDVAVSEGSILVGFLLDGRFDTHLFTVTITGSAESIPAPGGLALLAFGLAVLGLMRRRRTA